MFKRTALSRGLLIAFGGTAMLWGAPGHAQTTSDTVQQLERVEVTGSAIKRLDAETAVPVTVMRFDDLRKQGVTSVEQVLAMMGGNQSTQTTSQSVGLNTGGASFANLRGLGQNKTLVLLNGRRIANNAFDGSAPDLNMIPFAALDRVEVLRDGASALYGTDAIGGVINFITRKDLRGGSITLGADIPQHVGGKQANANLGFGFGDLSTDRFNVFGFIDLQKQSVIRASERDFGSTGLLPDKGEAKSSGTPNPANYGYTSTTGKLLSANPGFPGCDAPNGFPSGTKCRYDYTRFVDLIPDSQRNSAMVRGTLAVTPALNLNAEYFFTQAVVRTNIAPEPHTELTMNPGTKYYPGNGITPAPTNGIIDPTQPITVQWRTVPSGPRADKNINDQHRFVFSGDGSAIGWDYEAGAAYNLNTVHQRLTGGYNDRNILDPAVQNGIINPFGPQDAAGQAALDRSLTQGDALYGRSEVWSIDGHASREIGDWLGAGRAAAIAVGLEARHEKSHFYSKDPVFADAVVASTGVDPATDSRGSRSVYAAYTELNIPLLKTLDVTASIRYDKYSDFGNTVNTKGSFRYQPVSAVLLRGSIGTGFRAPSLYDLHAPNTYTNTANTWDDPAAGCTAGVATNPGFVDTACGTQFLTKNGGNTGLEPEKSRNYTLGIVLEPFQNLTVGFDLWMIHLRGQVGILADTTIFGDTTKYAGLFVRNAAGQLSTSGTECPAPATCGYVTDTSANLGKINTNGLDVSSSYRLRSSYGAFTFGFNGTYVHKYDYQNEQYGPYIRGAGVYSNGAGAFSGGGPIFRWQHTLQIQWVYNDYGFGVANRFKTGYNDQNDPTQIDPCCAGHKVRAYSLWDINGSYAVTKTFTLLAGVRNLFDTNPPFSNQGATFQVGYDPRLTDATGRSFFLKGTVTF